MREPELPPVFVSGDWEADLARQELRERGVAVPLGRRAFEIVQALILSAGELVTKDELMAHVWPGAIVEENTLQVHMSAVRKALGTDRGLLRTESGRGYRLLGDWAPRGEHTPPPSPPAPRTIQAAVRPISTNVPTTPYDLIGRATAAQELRDLVTAYRAVTLTGPGGIGKTTLALEVARSLLQSFQGDVWFVELVSLSDPALAPSAVAHVLGLKLGSDRISAEAVARAIGDRRVLIVLDNCEHIVDAAAALTETIARLCPQVTILATSREVLRIDGEFVYRVSPLDVPPVDQRDRDHVLAHGAVQLFMARTQALHSEFSTSEDTVTAVADICRHLDGIPLAIEFAAARATTLGLRQVAALLNDRFTLLTGGHRTALPRHQTLRATLDWSYELLPEPERCLLRRMAAFSAGFTLDAATFAMRDSGHSSARAVTDVANLVAKSLLVLDTSSSGGRWRLLETIRAYALEKLAEGGEAELAARRHAEFFRDFLGPSATRTESQAAQREIDNVRAALDWAFSPSGDATVGADLTAAFVPIWTQLSLLGECRRSVEMALAVPDLSPRTEITLRAGLGTALSYTSGPIKEAESTWQRVLELAERLDDVEYQLRALYGLWLYKILVCEYRAALSLTQKFQEVAERVAAAPDVPTADRMMAMVLHYLGDQTGAREYANRSLAAPIPANRQVYTARYGVDQRVGALVQLARALWLQGLPDQAMRAAQASVDEAAAVGHANSICLALADGACIVALLSGDAERADRFAAMLEEHADRHALGVWRTYARALRGRLLARGGRIADAAALLQSALADLRETPFDIRFQLYLVWLAEVLGASDQVSGAMAAIAEAQERAERTEERWYLAEILRIRGELLLRAAHAATEANEYFARSLDLAHAQNAQSWVLRATMSLVRQQRGRENAVELRAQLVGELGRFSEGFGTEDLVAARHLLDALHS